MFRESLDANARNALITVTPGNGTSFQSRSSTGGVTGFSNIVGLSAPYWLKLQRVGNVFTPYQSADGITWTQTAAPVTLSLPTTCYVGFAATAHNNTLLTAAQFDQISLLPPVPPAPTGLSATAGNAQITLSWNAVSGATDYTIQRSASSGGTYTNLVTGISATNYMNSGLADGATWYYTVAANGLPGVGTASAPVSATTYTAVENWRVVNFDTINNTGNAADSADPDGDGWTNAQEYISGTNPNNRSSLLKISQTQASGSNMLVSFPTVVGKTYRVERSDTLQSGSWVTVQDNIAGNGATKQITDTGGATQQKRFYRVVVW